MNITNLLKHDTHPLVQFIKYGIVGSMATAMHIVTFFLCGWFFLPCLTQGDVTVRLLGLTVPVITESTSAQVGRRVPSPTHSHAEQRADLRRPETGRPTSVHVAR